MTDPEDESELRNIVFSDNEIRVCAQRCTTCIFRPGNLMQLRPGRRSQMVRDALANEGHIVCHSTLDRDRAAICKGFADLPVAQRRSLALRVGAALGIRVDVPVDNLVEAAQPNPATTTGQNT